MKKHVYAYDLIRVVAMCMVVAVHAIPATSGSFGIWYDSCMQALLFPCNVLFFMMSGRLNIRDIPDDQLGRYYYRKFAYVLLPTLVYMFLMTIQYTRPEPKLSALVPFLHAYEGNVVGDFAGDVYWFMYSLFGMLLAAPFIAPALRGMSERRKHLVVGVFLLFSVPGLLMCMTSHSFNWRYPLGGFFGCFLIGAVLDFDRLAQIPRWKVALTTLCCICCSATLLRRGFPHTPVNDSSPLYYLAGIGMFVLMYGLGQNITKSRVLDFASRHSFGVYLCHLPLLKAISLRIPAGPLPLVHAQLTLCSVVAALAFAFVVDSLLVAPLQHLCDAAWQRHEQAQAARIEASGDKVLR